MAEHGSSTLTAREAPPYFDILFARLAEDDPTTIEAFGRHVHWGHWEDPSQADGSAGDYAKAAENLCHHVCNAAAIKPGQKLLDVGCGFGGTIASLNERFTKLDMTGVNIDQRQLDRATAKVRPQGGNKIKFMQADACRLNFPKSSFDIVMAVEAIFHFEDRTMFFEGVGRALKPGGALVLTDFVPPAEAVPMLRSFDTSADEATRRTYGQIDVLCSLESYEQLAQAVGLRLVSSEDISRNTLPTYPFLRKHLQQWDDPADALFFDRATAQLEMACRSGLLRYTILRFEKQGG